MLATRGGSAVALPIRLASPSGPRHAAPIPLRVRRATRLLQALARCWRNLSAPALFVWSFLALIGVGTAGLYLLPGLTRGPKLGLVDALFTMTSAACVTGLTVVDVSTRFTRWGQAWILLFVQLGGIGLVTLTSLIITVLGKRLSLRSEMIAGPPVEVLGVRDLRGLLGAVIRFTLGVEAIGAVVLWLAFLPRHDPLEAAWHALFHAVCAFCNAGFSTFSDSLAGHADSPAVLLTVALLVIVGGFGYLSSRELLQWWRAGGKTGPRRLSTHTFAAFNVTVVLLVGGFVLYALFEWRGVLAPLSTVDRLVNAFFLSVTARSAGFASVPFETVGNESAFLTVLLMLVGGSPGSTAGGIKTTALAVLVALAIGRMRGRRNVVLHHRSIPEGTVERTVSLALIATAVVLLSVFWLNFTETRGADLATARASFLPLLFEASSAFFTTGLSLAVTPHLTVAGKLIVIALMFVGRVGPLTFFAALSFRGRRTPRDVRPAREDVIIG